MGKWWSLLFGAVMLACFGLVALSPMFDWWLPEGASTHAYRVDRLFYVILWITAFFFVLTEALLVVFMFRFRSGAKPLAATPDRPPGLLQKLFPSEHRVEQAWTIVPAVILLYIAFAQVSTWADVKYQSRVWQDPRTKESAPKFEDKQIVHQVAVSARQFEWRMRYPSSKRLREWIAGQDQAGFKTFAKQPQMDDVHVVNELHVWLHQPVLVQLSTLDVLHSFNLPVMRVKQDAVPGKIIPVWFTPIKHNTIHNAQAGRWEDGHNPETKRNDTKHIWDIACAELCGWGHYRMIGRLYVHKDQEDFLAWLEKTEREQHTGKVAQAR